MQQGVKNASTNIGKCIIEKGNGKIPQTLKHFFRPLYTDVFKIAKIKTSDIYGRSFVHYMESAGIRIFYFLMSSMIKRTIHIAI